MHLFRLLRKSLDCCRNFGLDETLCRILARLRLISGFRSLDIYTRELVSFQELNPTGTMEVLEILPSEVGKFAFAEGLPSLAEIREQFSKGLRLVVLCDSNVIIAVDWVNSKFADLTHVGLPQLTFPAGTVYLCGAIVSPAHRDRRLGSLFKQAVLRKLKEEGIRRVFLAAYVKEARVHRWHLRNGLERWGRVFHFGWLGRNYRWVRLTKLGRTNRNFLNGIREGIHHA